MSRRNKWTQTRDFPYHRETTVSQFGCKALFRIIWNRSSEHHAFSIASWKCHGEINHPTRASFNTVQKPDRRNIYVENLEHLCHDFETHMQDLCANKFQEFKWKCHGEITKSKQKRQGSLDTRQIRILRLTVRRQRDQQTERQQTRRQKERRKAKTSCKQPKTKNPKSKLPYHDDGWLRHSERASKSSDMRFEWKP